MALENGEKIQDTKVEPPPSVAEPSIPATVTPEAAPVDSTTENKSDKTVSAFIKQRKELKAYKQRIAELESKISTPQPAPIPVPAPAKPTVETPKAQVQTVNSVALPAKAESGNEESAIQELAKDADVNSVPGGIVEIMDLVDSDPRLTRLNEIDSHLAFIEAKKMWASKLGINNGSKVPISPKVSGGMSGGTKDLQVLLAEVDNCKPGTKAYRDAVNKFNAANARK